LRASHAAGGFVVVGFEPTTFQLLIASWPYAIANHRASFHGRSFQLELRDKFNAPFLGSVTGPQSERDAEITMVARQRSRGGAGTYETLSSFADFSYGCCGREFHSAQRRHTNS
jgi:hypothetical protein